MRKSYKFRRARTAIHRQRKMTKSIFDNTGVSLALIIAISTCLGGVASSVVNSTFVSASTDREANVELIKLAISILSIPRVADAEPYRGILRPQNRVDNDLREWAVATINASSEIKFGKAARRALSDGTTTFSSRYTGGPPTIENKPRRRPDGLGTDNYVPSAISPQNSSPSARPTENIVKDAIRSLGPLEQ